jgi:lipid A ethanolaminephosphotransferase
MNSNLPYLRERTIPRPRIDVTLLNLIVAAFLVLCANGPFWRALAVKMGALSASQSLFPVVIGCGLFMLFNALISLVSIRPAYKPLLVGIILTTAVVSYFMNSYGVVIDKKMIVSVLETDPREASELLTWPLLIHVSLLGLLPSALLLMTRVSFRPWRKELMVRGGVILASVAVLAGLVLVNFKDIVLFDRTNKELRMYINPTYPLYSLIKVVRRSFQPGGKKLPAVIAADAVKGASPSRRVVVLVVGETARAQEFSLNGYQRDTNPQLAGRDVFNFSDVSSCGTDTAESLPCMFSHLGKEEFSRGKAEQYENLLDVLKRSGVSVVWRDNNSGSKGVADRVTYESLSQAGDARLCSSGECYDEILLKGLDRLINQGSGDMLIVLHQKGSHGPSYYKRSPERFKAFLPECSQDNVQDCDRRSIVNAYDNSILYTDHLLAQLIDLLKSRSSATALLYVSDHGESLGENNIYLHGLPYAIAPKEQTRVPLLFWASPSFLREQGIDGNRLRQQLHAGYSHDNLFHSMLGLFHIRTRIYRPELDLFQPARRTFS